MTTFSPTQLRDTLGSGLLCFPVTHMTAELTFDEPAFRSHLRWLAAYDARGVFPAGGTGEFFCHTPAEVGQIVRAAVAEAKPGVPVLAPAGYGTSLAVEMARDGERAGADGIFLLPPYLTELDQEGLKEHVRAVCRATSLGVVVYHRANARFTPKTFIELAEELPNLIGFKDGVGDVDVVAHLYAVLGPRLVYVGGLPTAETYALPYLELGATTYSSAIFNFAPQWASDFYASVVKRDRDDVYARIRDFVLPYLDIRNRRSGYAVSIVKAGMTAVGRSAGPVRPPLSDLTPAELAELTELIAATDSIERVG
ncbi:putative 5-dehydro-4-deoxyglucarate dehydratase [Acrocarpospora pleiomorpha]|uniref:Probable 5-dehydro-4-deoxyglucarate dehydratase n=1 Tax=Acrocarpospora pleiomorpha TaxID=90975 RepID=A0A5M3XV35_9ACTN|nr:5-dehydro-4-deoxyglucarate dehydratase [Acrocarpospora pleiomorpha]GES23163.1 putative 5-dehydro-4-deoxyglucarate dehydratase [Acrocarpospora pleiomorpha]